MIGDTGAKPAWVFALLPGDQGKLGAGRIVLAGVGAGVLDGDVVAIKSGHGGMELVRERGDDLPLERVGGEFAGERGGSVDGGRECGIRRCAGTTRQGYREKQEYRHRAAEKDTWLKSFVVKNVLQDDTGLNSPKEP